MTKSDTLCALAAAAAIVGAAAVVSEVVNIPTFDEQGRAIGYQLRQMLQARAMPDGRPPGYQP